MVEGKTLWVFGDSTSRNHGLLDTDEHYKVYKEEKKYFSEYIKEHLTLKTLKILPDMEHQMKIYFLYYLAI